MEEIQHSTVDWDYSKTLTLLGTSKTQIELGEFCVSLEVDEMDASFVTPCVRITSESTPNVVEEGSHQGDVEVDPASATENGQGQLILESDGTSRNSVVPTTLEVFLQDTASQRGQDLICSSKHFWLPPLLAPLPR